MVTAYLWRRKWRLGILVSGLTFSFATGPLDTNHTMLAWVSMMLFGFFNSLEEV